MERKRIDLKSSIRGKLMGLLPENSLITIDETRKEIAIFPVGIIDRKETRTGVRKILKEENGGIKYVPYALVIVGR